MTKQKPKLEPEDKTKTFVLVYHSNPKAILGQVVHPRKHSKDCPCELCQWIRGPDDVPLSFYTNASK